jgi:hypothetical protein
LPANANIAPLNVKYYKIVQRQFAMLLPHFTSTKDRDKKLDAEIHLIGIAFESNIRAIPTEKIKLLKT